jgi:NitT/TauT family transport system ATP-binding protein
MAVSVLQVRQLGHRFGNQIVLRDVSLDLAAGEIVAIVGPSGCGKTTLLRACAGLEQPSQGSVTTSTSPVGFVFQEPALLAWRRVIGNARLLSENNEDVEELLRITGLWDDRNKWPFELSGGMKMRLSLVRTLAAKPRLVLLDEPFGALDQITRHRLHDEFLRLHAQQRFAALLVTHAIDEAVYLADRVLVMSASPGEIVGEFTVPSRWPRESRSRYSSEFAEFCGTISKRLETHS